MSDREDRKRRLARDRGVVKPRQLAHVVRRTSRFEELVRWYCTVLGAEVVHSDGTLAFLTYDEEHHRIAIAAPPAARNATMSRGRPGAAVARSTTCSPVTTPIRVAPSWVNVASFMRRPPSETQHVEGRRPRRE